MKRIVSFILLFVLIICMGNCGAYAESTSSYTADELAYVVYAEINSAYHYSMRYLNTLGGLWESLLETTSWDDMDYWWMIEYGAANNHDREESIQRTRFLITLAEEKFGIEPALVYETSMLVDAIKNEAKKTASNPKDAIFLLLKWGEEVGYLRSKNEFEAEFENGMKAIQMIMKLDANYMNLNALKEYYKEVSAIYTYLDNFSDSYNSFTEKMKQYQENYDSWEIEFDFMLGTNKYASYGDAYSRFMDEIEAQK